jgi:hypothetical protein
MGDCVGKMDPAPAIRNAAVRASESYITTSNEIKFYNCTEEKNDSETAYIQTDTNKYLWIGDFSSYYCATSETTNGTVALESASDASDCVWKSVWDRDGQWIKTGDIVTVKVQPSEGYAVEDVNVYLGSEETASEGDSVEVEESESQTDDSGVYTYTFTMPEADVNVAATYCKIMGTTGAVILGTESQKTINGNAVWTYDADTGSGTLTLKNEVTFMMGIQFNVPATIVLEDDCNVTVYGARYQGIGGYTSDAVNVGIYTESNLTILGNGTMNVYSSGNENSSVDWGHEFALYSYGKNQLVIGSEKDNPNLTFVGQDALMGYAMGMIPAMQLQEVLLLYRAVI